MSPFAPAGTGGIHPVYSTFPSRTLVVVPFHTSPWDGSHLTRSGVVSAGGVRAVCPA
jgi:hypothetical protein